MLVRNKLWPSWSHLLLLRRLLLLVRPSTVHLLGCARNRLLEASAWKNGKVLLLYMRSRGHRNHATGWWGLLGRPWRVERAWPPLGLRTAHHGARLMHLRASVLYLRAPLMRDASWRPRKHRAPARRWPRDMRVAPRPHRIPHREPAPWPLL